MSVSKKVLTTEKENGRFYTPEFLVKNILDMSGYTGINILKKNVIDNSCGDGAFLCEIVSRYCKEAINSHMSLSELKRDLEEYIHGIEIEIVERNKCIDRLNFTAAVFGVSDIRWDIICADTLTVNKYDGKMDFVLGNPPYVRVHNLGDTFNEIKGFSFSQGGMTDLFIVFYEIGIKMLSEKGTLGYITPSSFFNSIAGLYMRQFFIRENLLDSIVDLKHFQAFNSTTYTAIVVLKKNRQKRDIDYFRFDEKNRIPYYVDSLLPSDFCIADNFYFSDKKELSFMAHIYCNIGKSDITVKNGYATLCDDVFINDFDFDSKFIIPVIKSSKGVRKRIFYPYNEHGNLIPEEEIRSDIKMYSYLLDNKERLIKRSNEKDHERFWYSFGRSQAINDTYRDKLSVNALIRNESDFKFMEAPSGTGVYSGLYIVSDTVPIGEIKKALMSKEFAVYVSLLGKYKSGGYYTFSSKDVKVFLDYKFAYDGGIFSCLQTSNF